MVFLGGGFGVVGLGVVVYPFLFLGFSSHPFFFFFFSLFFFSFFFFLFPPYS